MFAINTGGSAFPTNDNAWAEGMTLRDWFAGQALALGGGVWGGDFTKTAANAYEIADAMILARDAWKEGA